MQFENTKAFAQTQDANDPLKDLRNRFHHPNLNGKPATYFCGNSLGLAPKSAVENVNQELDDWAEFAVEGHFHAKTPWFSYQDIFPEQLSKLVGALPKEVTVMNGLTVNLHLLMVSFYRPGGKRYKIICEAKAFPSDQYALESQVSHHGLNPKDTIIEIAPREGEDLIREEDILNAISENGDELALVMFGGVNYYTGQVFDMKTITAAGHKVGAKVGFDLAHGAGNILLNLHDWDVDFACWCSYKYLNSGPGNVSGMFVHERHCNNPELNRFAGWWGNDPDQRFKMQPGFTPAEGARGWQLSNVPVFGMAVHKSALDIHAEVGMDLLREKSLKLTGYLESLLDDLNSKDVRIITPRNPEQRGCQLSLYIDKEAKKLHQALLDEGVITDYREPNVIRLAPVPLYNSFEDVWTFVDILRKHLRYGFAAPNPYTQLMLIHTFQTELLEAGCDEAGRGCLAGPVVAAAVILDPNNPIEGLDDSKKINEKTRELLRPEIEAKALAWAVGIVSNVEIDEINILKGSFVAMHRALDQLKTRPQLIIVDGNRFIPYQETPHETIVKGDGKYQNIAAASILAKTHRDEIMRKLHEQYSHFGWDRNKGYPTKEHRLGIRKHGPTELHRMSFQLLQPELPFKETL